jgi:hypothetical protein
VNEPVIEKERGMSRKEKETFFAVPPESIEEAGCLLEQLYLDEMMFPGSPVTEEEVRLNLD